MAGRNTTQNRKLASRAIIGALVLWLVFSGMAAAEQLYVNESGWWRVQCEWDADTGCGGCNSGLQSQDNYQLTNHQPTGGNNK